MSKEKIYLNKHLVLTTETRELWDEPHAFIGVDPEEVDIIFLVNEHGRADGEIIPIDEMMEHLKELKRMGSTHVALDWHCDHLTYVMSGYHLLHATPEQIDDHLKRISDAKALVKKVEIEQLEKRLNELKNEKNE